MKGRWGLVAALAALLLFGFRRPLDRALTPHRAVPRPDASGEPRQDPADREPFVFLAGGRRYRLTPRFAWDGSAVVVGEKTYRFDALAPLAAVDLALAWGPVLDPPYAGRISYLQTGRFYLWNARGAGLDRATIVAHTANTHVIAASSRLRRIAASVSAGDVVRLEGWLVDADGIDDPAFRVRTSTARTDEGPGACEVVFVRRLTVNRSAYE